MTRIDEIEKELADRPAKSRRPKALHKDDPRHGNNGYDNYGCRCEICREAHYERQKQYRHKASKASGA